MVIKIRDWAGHFQTYPAEKGLLNNDKEWPLKANSYAFEVLFAVPIIFVLKNIILFMLVLEWLDRIYRNGTWAQIILSSNFEAFFPISMALGYQFELISIVNFS